MPRDLTGTVRAIMPDVNVTSWLLVTLLILTLVNSHENAYMDGKLEKDCNVCQGEFVDKYFCDAKKPADKHRCIHAAHPFDMVGPVTRSRDLSQGVKIQMSNNVFVENLHKTRNLRKTYYVTDNKQTMEFYWVRESGLQIHVGVHDVHIVPEYYDVTYDSDNKDVLHNQQQSIYSPEDLGNFRSIIRNYCRHPIPKDYTLTLEINRDRTTVAKHFKCDSSNSRLPSCPSYLNEGDYFLYRSTNEACQKMGTFPQPLLPTSNSIVCTQDTDLLKDIFYQTHRTERPIKFPPRRCRQAESKCQECLSKLMCNSTGPPEDFEANCCQIDCYSLRDCKVAFSLQCTSNPIQCAMGDAYRYTTRPNFDENFSKFQCHIRHRSQENFYTMFYHIKIPGYERNDDIETPKFYKTIPFDTHSHRKYKTSYLNVEHNTGMDAYEDVILVGSYVDNNDVDFMAYKMKSPSDFLNDTFDVVEVNPNVYVTNAQVTSPFMHSTASWSRDNNCDKDISKLKPPQKLYTEEHGEGVNVHIKRSETAYNYLLKSIDRQPYIRFSLSGSESILTHYFDGTNVGLLQHSTVTVHLEQSPAIWSIFVSGRTSACPAFVRVIVDDLSVRAEVGQYDLLVYCPSNFNITVKIPRNDLLGDRSFKLTVGDSLESRYYYVSALVVNGHNKDLSLSKRNVIREYDHGYNHLFIIVGVTVASVLILHLATAFFEVTTVQKVSFKFSEPSRHTWTESRGQNRPTTTIRPTYCQQDQLPNDLSKRSKTKSQYAFIFIYIALKVIYSFLITFTSVLTLLTVVLRKDIQVLSHLPVFQKEKYNESQFLIQDINEFAKHELIRQDKLLFTANKACANYLAQRFNEILQRISQETINSDLDRSPSLITLTERLDRLFKHRMLQYEKKVNQYTDQLQANFTRITRPAIVNYKKYLTQVFKNKWMQFPRLLFNRSDYREARPSAFKSTHPSGEKVDFGAFLPVEEVENVQLWSLNWWERYRITKPVFASDFTPVLKDHCPLDINKNMTSWSLDTFYSRVNSSLFFTVDIYKDIKSALEEFTQEAALSEKQPRTYLSDIVNDYRRALDINAVWILFIILDALMLFYRFNHIFFNAHLLFYGFDEYSFVGDKPQEHYISDQYTQNRCLTNDINNRDLYMNNVEEKIEFLTAIPETTNFEKCRTKSNKYERRDTFKQKHFGFYTSDFCSKNTALEYMQSPTVPKVVIGLVVLVQVILVNEFISVILSAEVLYDLEGFRIFLVGLDVQVNRTNWHLQEQAKFYNEIYLEAYKEQLNSELVQFQRLIKFFNHEQDRMMSNYIKESCSIEHHLQDNRTCDLRLPSSKINITLLPCGLMPTQAKNYQGFNRESHKFQLMEDFEPYLASTHDIVVKASYVIIIILAVTLIIHVMGLVIFKFLKTRHKFPVNRTYVTKSPSVAMGANSNKLATSNACTDEENENETVDETNDSDKLSVDILQSCSNVSGDDEDYEDFIETKV